MKKFTVALDSKFKFTIEIPEVQGEEQLNCGWLLEQVTLKYARLVREQRTSAQKS